MRNQQIICILKYETFSSPHAQAFKSQCWTEMELAML